LPRYSTLFLEITEAILINKTENQISKIKPNHQISDELRSFRDEYAPNLDFNDPKLFMILIEKFAEVKQKSGE